jgi:hypothetical protein
MSDRYFVIAALVFTCGAGVGSWRAASVVSSRSKAATHLAEMAQRNAEEKAKAAELTLETSEAAERLARQELALEKNKREAVEQALNKALKAKLEDSARQEQTKLDNAKIQLFQQTANTKTRKTRIVRKHDGKAEAYDASRLQFEGSLASRSVRTHSRDTIAGDRPRISCVVTLSGTRHNKYRRLYP